jgi:hypothetical protein
MRSGLWLLPLLLAPAGATGQEPPWDLKQLMAGLAHVRHAEAWFVERKYLQVLDKPLETTGRLLYVAPDRLEKHTLTPRPELLVVKGDLITIQVAGSRKLRKFRLQGYPTIWGFVESIRATLAGDLWTLQRFYSVELKGRRDDWELKLAPRVQAMRSAVKVIQISGAADSIRRIEIAEAEGDRSVMQISPAGP